MKIFLDLDMTLNSMSFDWCTFLGVKSEDVKYHGWIRDFLGSKADSWWATPGIYNTIKPLPGSQIFVEFLADLTEVSIITHTHDCQNPQEKEDWIYKYYGKSITEIIHTHEKYRFTKGAILIDDCPRHVYDHVRANNNLGIIFNYMGTYGWANKSCLPIRNLNHHYIYEASTYAEVIDIITRQEVTC